MAKESLSSIAINRSGNTLALPIRGIGTVGMATLDLANILDTMTKQGYEIAVDTRTKLKEMWIHSLNKGSVIQKTTNTALSTLLTPVAPLEWAVRTVVEPLRNWAKNLRGATSNFFKNIWNSVGHIFSKKKVSDFKFHHTEPVIEKNPITKKNRFSKIPNRVSKNIFWNKK